MIWVVVPAWDDEAEVVQLVEGGNVYHVSLSQQAAAERAKYLADTWKQPYRVYKLVESHYFKGGTG